MLAVDFMNKHMLLNKRPRNNFPLCLQDGLAAFKLFAGMVLGTRAWQCCSGMDIWYSPNWGNDHDSKDMDALVLDHTEQEWKVEHAKPGQGP